MEPETTETETETKPTPDEIRAQANEELRKAVERQEALREARTVANLIKTLDESARTITEEQKEVREVIEIVAPAPERRSALSAARTQLASLSDFRYRTLPKWQQDFRDADSDHMVARYFRGLWMASAHHDTSLLQQVRDEAKLMRADLLVGATGGTDGVFDGTAGELLPLPVANYINIALYRLARFRALTRQNTATNGQSLRIPLQSTISSSLWKAEAALIIAGEPSVVDHLNLDLKKLTSLGILSNEILADEIFGIVQWLLNDVVMEMAETEDEALYSSGDGILEPNGFEAADTGATTNPPYQIALGVLQAANKDLLADADLDYAHIVKMYYSLPEKERASSIWSGPDAVAEALSLVVDANGRPIFRQANDAGGVIGDAAASAQTGTLFGRPFHNLPGKSAALGSVTDSTENRLYLSNMERTYATLEKGGVQVAVSTDDEFKTDRTVYRFVRRIDGGVTGNNITGRFQYIYTGGIDTVAA